VLRSADCLTVTKVVLILYCYALQQCEEACLGKLPMIGAVVAECQVLPEPFRLQYHNGLTLLMLKSPGHLLILPFFPSAVMQVYGKVCYFDEQTQLQAGIASL
jgi:hypothetical protein